MVRSLPLRIVFLLLVLVASTSCARRQKQQQQAVQYEAREESTAITNLAVVSPENLYVVNTPSFSTDGTLVYSAKQWVEGQLPFPVSIWRSPAKGGAATKLVPAGDQEHLAQGRSCPTVSNVYFSLACSVYSTSKGGVGGRRKYPGTGYCDFQPVPFPDESRILFSSCVLGKDCLWNDANYIWVVNPDGTNMTQLRQGQSPNLSPDAKSIAFSYGGNIWTMRIDGTEATNVSASDRFLDGEPSYSPDGSKIYFSRRKKEPKATSDIWVMNSNGTEQVQLTMNLADDWGPYAAPDGLVYFVTNRGALVNNQWPARIWRMQLAGVPLQPASTVPAPKSGGKIFDPFSK